jgi:predicted Holliday junction resolvase-like endonuclease
LAEVRRSADEHIDKWKVIHEKEIRKDALKKSRSTMRGQATEHLAPLMTGLDHLCIKDFRFLGSPIDFIIFNGASKVSDGSEDEIGDVVFLDIKTGSASLSKVQRAIKRAVLAGNVRFEVFNPDVEE